MLGVTLIDGVTEGLTLKVGVTLGLTVILGVTVGVIVIEGVILGVTDGVGVTDGGNKLLVTEKVPQVSLFITVIEIAEYGNSITIPLAKSSTEYPLPIRFTLS